MRDKCVIFARNFKGLSRLRTTSATLPGSEDSGEDGSEDGSGDSGEEDTSDCITPGGCTAITSVYPSQLPRDSASYKELRVSITFQYIELNLNISTLSFF